MLSIYISLYVLLQHKSRILFRNTTCTETQQPRMQGSLYLCQISWLLTSTHINGISLSTLSGLLYEVSLVIFVLMCAPWNLASKTRRQQRIVPKWRRIVTPPTSFPSVTSDQINSGDAKRVGLARNRLGPPQNWSITALIELRSG